MVPPAPVDSAAGGRALAQRNANVPTNPLKRKAEDPLSRDDGPEGALTEDIEAARKEAVKTLTCCNRKFGSIGAIQSHQRDSKRCKFRVCPS